MIFSEIRDQILFALQNPDLKFNIPEQVALYEAFVVVPFYSAMSNQPENQGIVPFVMLMSSSGQTYFISLKVLLPDLEFPRKEKDAQEE